MALLSVALNTARTLLNDDVSAVWSDASLIPKMQEAHRELQAKLWEVGSPVVRAQSPAISVLTGAKIITSPVDMLTPFKLVEYANTVETLSDAVDMTEAYYLPTIAPAATLKYWAWRGEAIEFIGATADRKVVIYYRKLITIPTAAGDQIGILFGELYLAARAAALTHGSVGNIEAAGFMAQKATESFAQVVAAQRGQQRPQVRP
jgi:hypothetical protein